MKFLKFLASVVLLLNVCSLSVLANEDSYTYTVRVFANGNIVSEQKKSQGESLDPLDASSIPQYEEDNIVYNPIAIVESGKDRMSDALYLSGTPVMEDQDYVVVYQKLVDPVTYTIRFLTTDGTQLLEPQTFTGNRFEEAIHSAPYIDGYQAQARNYRFTLKNDGAVYNMYYESTTPAPIPGTTTTITDTNTETETVTTPGTTTTPATTPATTPGTTPAPGDTTTPGETTNPGETTTPEGEEHTTPQEPEDLVDIDEDNTPLAGPEDSEDSVKPSFMNQYGWYIGLGAGALLLIGLGAYFLKKKKEA